MHTTSYQASWGERLVENILLIPLLLSVCVLVLAAISTQLIIAFVQMVMDVKSWVSSPVYSRTTGRDGPEELTTFGGKVWFIREAWKEVGMMLSSSHWIDFGKSMRDYVRGR